MAHAKLCKEELRNKGLFDARLLVSIKERTPEVSKSGDEDGSEYEGGLAARQMKGREFRAG